MHVHTIENVIRNEFPKCKVCTLAQLSTKKAPEIIFVSFLSVCECHQVGQDFLVGKTEENEG